jgi:hypothetical protein
LPNEIVVAALINPANPTHEKILGNLQEAAGIIGVRLRVLRASTEREIDAAFAECARSVRSDLRPSRDVLLIST